MYKVMNWLGAILILGDFVWIVFFTPELNIFTLIFALFLLLSGIFLVIQDENEINMQ